MERLLMFLLKRDQELLRSLQFIFCCLFPIDNIADPLQSALICFEAGSNPVQQYEAIGVALHYLFYFQSL